MPPPLIFVVAPATQLPDATTCFEHLQVAQGAPSIPTWAGFPSTES